MGILAILGFLVIGFIVFLVLITIAAVIGAVFAWRVIAPEARYFSLKIDRDGVRAITEHGEVIPGTATYVNKSKRDDLEKPKRRLTVGDDGELVDADFYDVDDADQSYR